MAFSSKCGSCGHSTFEIKVFEPRGGTYKLSFVQCASCGVPVSTEGYYNTDAQLEALKQQLAGLDQRIRTVEAVASNVDHNLARLARLIQA